MKKRQGTTESVSSKNCVKERKAKPKEMTNIARNTWRNTTKLAAENVWMRKKTKSEKKKKENKASWKAHTFLHRGQTWAKETCSRMKQNQFATAETAWEWKKTKTENSGANTQGSEHHQPVPSQYKGDGPTIKELRGCCLVVGAKRVYIWFSTMASFRNIPC